jgi:hypothetical protein
MFLGWDMCIKLIKWQWLGMVLSLKFWYTPNAQFSLKKSGKMLRIENNASLPHFQTNPCAWWGTRSLSVQDVSALMTHQEKLDKNHQNSIPPAAKD